MRVLYVAPFSKRDVDPAEIPSRYPLLQELPAEMRQRGHRVRVLLHGSRRWTGQRNGVVYESWSPSPIVRAVATWLNRAKPHFGPAYYELIATTALRLRYLRPDIVHVFGLALDLHLALLLPAARLAGTRTVVHYHGGLPGASRSLGQLQRWNGRWIDRAAFTSRSLAEPWIEAGVLRPEQVVNIVETSTTMRGIARAEARRRTGMTGDPVCLSAGRLHPIKDPVTMLRGFEKVVEERPAARLYLYYLTDEMIDETRRIVAESSLLHPRVEFRGRAAAHEMEAIYSSADYLLQASRREWSGLAVLEAMACGCVPVISSIPAFDAMTGYGRCGALFSPGDPGGLARALIAHEERGRDIARLEAARYFREEMSFAAMARKFERVYQELIREA